MDFPQTHAAPQTSPKPSKSNTKCSWCDRKRARNDLCNVCRQKVESRARRLMEQKLEGDMAVLQKVMNYLNLNIPSDRISSAQIMSLILETFPYLMLKFQSENTYRGKKGNRCWCLPESVLKKLIAPFYAKDTDSAAAVSKGGRQELCNLLMRSVATSFSRFGVHEMTDGDQPPDSDIKMADGMVVKKEKLQSALPPPMSPHHRPFNPSMASPPRKRQRPNQVQPDYQIWGRSDTNLLSFDVRRCQEFLSKFEHDVLRGDELHKMEPTQQVTFLKQRCGEFVKMLTELRDYVLHLRSRNDLEVTAKNQDIAKLQQRVNGLSGGLSNGETLLRCTATLLSKLSPSPVDIGLLRANMAKLEHYHSIACNELAQCVQIIEGIGARMGFQRASDQNLIQYVSHIQRSQMSNRRMDGVNNSNSLQTLYVQQPSNHNSHSNSRQQQQSSSLIQTVQCPTSNISNMNPLIPINAIIPNLQNFQGVNLSFPGASTSHQMAMPMFEQSLSMNNGQNRGNGQVSVIEGGGGGNAFGGSVQTVQSVPSLPSAPVNVGNGFNMVMPQLNTVNAVNTVNGQQSGGNGQIQKQGQTQVVMPTLDVSGLSATNDVSGLNALSSLSANDISQLRALGIDIQPIILNPGQPLPTRFNLK